jgi:hypothetical protein
MQNGGVTQIRRQQGDFISLLTEIVGQKHTNSNVVLCGCKVSSLDTLSMGDINTKKWCCRLGVGQRANGLALQKLFL